jgi:flagellar hook-length control protein FliK
MDISAVATGEGKSDVQCANPLVMLKALHLAKTGGKTDAQADGKLSQGESAAVDPFFATLKEQMVMLLNQSQPAGTQKSECFADLLPQWLKLIEGKENIVSGMIPQEALALLTAQMGELDGITGNSLLKSSLDFVKDAGLFKDKASAEVKIIAEIKALLASGGEGKKLSGLTEPKASVVDADKISKSGLPGMIADLDKGTAGARNGQENSAQTDKSDPGAIRKATPPGVLQGDTLLNKASAKESDTGQAQKTPGLYDPIARLAADAKQVDASASKPVPGSDKIPVDQASQKAGESMVQNQAENRNIPKAISETAAVRTDQTGTRELHSQMNRPADKENLSKENAAQVLKSEAGTRTENRAHMAQNASASQAQMNAAADELKTGVRSKAGTFEKVMEAPPSSSNVSNVAAQHKPSLPIEPAQIIQRVAVEFRETLAQESGRVRMTLTPPSLGTLELDVMVRNGKVRVMLFADSREVQRMLSGNIDSLKSSLQGQGMTIDRCEVMMQDRREAYSQGFAGQAFADDSSDRSGNRRQENHKEEADLSKTVRVSAKDQRLPETDRISLFV